MIRLCALLLPRRGDVKSSIKATDSVNMILKKSVSRKTEKNILT